MTIQSPKNSSVRHLGGELIRSLLQYRMWRNRKYWMLKLVSKGYASGQPILNLVSGLSKIVCT